MKNKVQVLASIAVITLALPIVAQEKAVEKKGILGREEHMLLTASGRIEAIDHASREITPG